MTRTFRHEGPLAHKHWRRTLCTATVIVVTAASSAASIVTARSAAAGTSCLTGTGTFTATTPAGEQCYLVPVGVSTLDVTVVGAPGGTANDLQLSPGGEGASVSATLDVSALGLTSRTLYFDIGAGGVGGAGQLSRGGSSAGGNSSDIRTCSVTDPNCGPDSRVIVAGGGGGGSMANGGYAGGAGGNAGGSNPASSAPGMDGVFPGSSGADGTSPSTGGGGGSDAVGAGGTAGNCTAGASGRSADGGVGGYYGNAQVCDGYYGFQAGGSGGGGYFGGGGGGDGGTPSGGGGGSSYASPTAASNAMFGLDPRGTPEIVVTGPAATLTTSAPSGASVACATETSGGNSPTFTAPAPCVDTYLEGSTLQLTATPPPDVTTPVESVWSGCESTTGDACTLIMNGGKTVGVTFEQYQTLTAQTYSADQEGSGVVRSSVGSISCPDVNCTERVPYSGDSPGIVTLNAVPATDSYLSGWTGCDDDSQVTCTVTMRQDKTVTASFQKCPTGSGTCSPITGTDSSFTSVCPAGGSTDGGSVVTVHGHDLASGNRILFDGQAATTDSVNADNTELTVTTPAHAAGSVDVTLEDDQGNSHATFTYEDATPELDSILPGAAYYVDADPVTLTGSNLYDIGAIQVGSQTVQPTAQSCDGTSVTFVPPDQTDLDITSEDVSVTTPAGPSNTVTLGRTQPYPQNSTPTSSSYTPVTQDLLGSDADTQAETFTYTEGDVTVTVNVPAGALPAGTRIDIYKGDTAKLQASLPSGSTAQSGYAIAWTTPDGTHPNAPNVGITVNDPSIKATQTTYAATDGTPDLIAMALNYTIPADSNYTELVTVTGDDRHVVGHPITVHPGETISGAQVIAAGGGNVIAAGGGNLAFGGGFVIAAGGGNVIAAGGGNVIAAGGGNVIAAGGGNFSVLAATAAAMAQINSTAAGVIAAGGGNLGDFDINSMISLSGDGIGGMSNCCDPEYVRADPPSPSDAPAGVSAGFADSDTEGFSDATVSWTAPASSGGGAVTSYAVQVFQDGSLMSTVATAGSDTNLAIPYLPNGHVYRFAVEAFNGGYGPASDRSDPVTVQPSPPGAPTHVSATADGTEATVSWTAPADDGGTPITGYTVQVIDGGPIGGGTVGDPRNVAFDSTDTVQTVTDLTAGDSYVFTVTATNGVDGATSQPSNSVLAGSVPDAVTGLAATAGDGKVSLSWTAPAHDGGMAVSDYLVYRSAISGGPYTRLTTDPNNLLTTTSYTDDTVTNGTRYFYVVTAENAKGESASSDEVSALPQAADGGGGGGGGSGGEGPAGPPTSVSATSESPTGTATATVVDGNGDTVVSATGSGEGTVTAATYSGNPDPPATFAADGTFVDVKVQAGSSFSNVQIRVCSPSGGNAVDWYGAATGAWQEVVPSGTLTDGQGCLSFTLDATSTPTLAQLTGTVFAVADAEAPAAPQQVRASAGDAAATVTWSAPASDGGSPVTGYLVTASPGGIQVPASGTATWATVTGLRNGQAYTFVVAARNAAGTSAASTASNPVTPRHPAASRAAEHPTLRCASPRRHTVRCRLAASPRRSHLVAVLRAVTRGGHRQRVATSVTDPRGRAHFFWRRLRSGRHERLVAHLRGSATTLPATSRVVRVTVT